MDMQMPRMDGLAATREIRRLEREAGAAPTPIAMLTANAMDEHRQMAFSRRRRSPHRQAVHPGRLFAGVARGAGDGSGRPTRTSAFCGRLTSRPQELRVAARATIALEACA